MNLMNIYKYRLRKFQGIIISTINQTIVYNLCFLNMAYTRDKEEYSFSGMPSRNVVALTGLRAQIRMSGSSLFGLMVKKWTSVKTPIVIWSGSLVDTRFCPQAQVN